MDPFLTRDEKRQVQKMYEYWNKHAKSILFVDKLVSAGMLHEREHQEFSAKLTEYERNRYLYDAVISRSTYDRICKLRDILYDVDDTGHTALADMLPRRNPASQQQAFHHQSTPEHEMQWDTYPNSYQHYEPAYPDYKNTGYTGYSDVPYRRQEPYGYSSYHPNSYNHPYQAPPESRYGASPEPQNQTPPGPRHQAPPEPQHQAPPEQKYHIPPDDQNDPKYAYGHKPRSDDLAQQSSGSASLPQQQQKQAVVTNTRKKKKLNAYPTRPNNPESGKGLCVIIANFTYDLLGYLNDISMITEFFGKTLGYTVLGGDDSDATDYRNLTKAQCQKKIDWLKMELENGQYKTCDRLFFFVLSHGDETGIKMIPPDNKDNQIRDRIKTEKLVDCFAHDQLPNLKGYPKCFFIQVCSGVEIAKAAHSSTHEKEEEKKKAQVVAVGADTLVCQAAKDGKYSWVSQGEKAGSWFVQATLGVFQEYHQEEHILDMLTEMNDRVSKRSGLTITKHGSQEKVYQLPAISNNLTKKLYLS